MASNARPPNQRAVPSADVQSSVTPSASKVSTVAVPTVVGVGGLPMNMRSVVTNRREVSLVTMPSSA
jgi:hypothetical protein